MEEAVTAARNQRASSGVDVLVEVLSRVLVRRALIERDVVAGEHEDAGTADHSAAVGSELEGRGKR
jgi:hypothetical protein